MEGFQPQRWLRLFGVIASCTIVLRQFADQISAHPDRMITSWRLPLELLAFAGFLAAFLYCTRSVDPGPPRPAPLAVLLAQVPLGLAFGAELLIVATIAVPFVLDGRAARVWLAVEIGLMWALSLPGANPQNTVLSPGLEHTPFAAALALTLVEATTWILFAFCAGYLIVRAERNRRELVFRNAELEAMQGLLAETSAIDERLRISRELHDTVGHHLVGLSVNLELASHLAADKALAPVRRAQLIAKLLLAEIRETVGAMRGNQQLDLRGALGQLAAGITDLRMHVDVSPEVDRAEAALAHFLFRCAQEAITNTRKHARARNFWLTIAAEGAGFRLRARDDGQGAAAPAPGNGLRGMSERAGQLGATLSVKAAHGAGFQIEVWAPDRRSETEQNR